MSTFLEDFEGYSVSADPSSGKSRFGTQDSFSVVSSPVQEGSRAVQVTASSAEHDGYWEDNGLSTGNIDAKVALRSADLGNIRSGAMARCHFSDSQNKGYVAMIRNADTIRLAALRNTSETIITTSNVSTLSDDTWYWIKLACGRDSNDDLKVRYWADGDSEPGTWLIDTTDSSFDETKTGIGIYARVASGSVFLDYLEGDDRAGTAYTKTLTEAFEIAGSIVNAPEHVILNTLEITESLPRTIGRTLTLEGFTISESIQKTGGKVLSDTFEYIDSINKVIGKVVSNTFNITESLLRSSVRILTDSFSISDSIERSSSRNLSDTIEISETFSGTKVTQKILTASITIAETITKGMIKIFSSGISLAGSFLKGTKKSISDSINVLDGNGIVSQLVEDSALDFGKTEISSLNQGIIPNVSGDVLSISVKLAKVGSPTDQIKMRIYTYVDTPGYEGYSGTLVGTADALLDYTAMSSYPTYTEHEFTFTGVNLTGGERYRILISRTSPSNDTNYFSIKKSSSDVYSQTLLYWTGYTYSSATGDLYFIFTQGIDLFTAILIRMKSISEAFAIAEAKIVSLQRTLLENTAISEAFSITSDIIKILTENFVVSETLSIVKSFVRTLSEGMVLSGSIIKTTVKVLTGNLSVSEASTQLKVFVRSFLDSLTITESFSRMFTVIRTFVETFSVSDAIINLVRKGLMRVAPIIKWTGINFSITRTDPDHKKQNSHLSGKIKKL